MRAVFVLGLAACWSPAGQKPGVERPERAEVAGNTEPEPAAAEPREQPPFVMPARVADALAKEPLAGNVLVASVLHPTAAAARADAAQPRRDLVAMQVIKDHGDVVEVSTGSVQDCVKTFAEPYQLRMFVRRDRLVPRTKVEVTRTFPDGTAVAIDRGAPISTDRGLGWHEHVFTATKVLPDVDQLTYATPAKVAEAGLPAQPGREQLLCMKNQSPMTLAAWEESKRRERDAKLRERQAERERAAELRRAEMERRRPEREREQKARLERERKECEKRERAREAKEAAKRAKQAKQHGPKTARDQALEAAKDAGLFGKLNSCAMMASVLGSPGDDLYGGLGDASGDLFADDVAGSVGFGGFGGHGSVYVPSCGIHDPSHDDIDGDRPARKVAVPAVNGNAVPWPTYRDHVQNQHVVQHGTYYLADLGYRCGRIRVAVERAAVREAGGTGSGIMGGGVQVPVWIPKPGPVTWPDGSPAGTYSGTKLYRDVDDRGDRFCVKVSGVAELVCHSKKTATQSTAPRHRVD